MLTDPSLSLALQGGTAIPQPQDSQNMLTVRKISVSRMHSLPNDSYMFHTSQPRSRPSTASLRDGNPAQHKVHSGMDVPPVAMWGFPPQRDGVFQAWRHQTGLRFHVCVSRCVEWLCRARRELWDG